ncbi:MAG: hypothetical protein WC455_06830 [Dehalococcoidia bacterium]|jgi:hypothetical protein
MTKILKQHAERRLADVPDQHVFWCHDGRILHNLRELMDALEMMSDEAYAYHANKEKNDFSAWVKDIIGDDKLARDLTRSSDRRQAFEYVKAREVFLLSKL